MTEARPHVVIVGAGFGGLAATRALARAPVDITLIDKRNHHVFQPLLYQVATAALSPADIAAPVRAILRRQSNVRVVLDRVAGVEPSNRRVLLTEGGAISYDLLVLATGAEHSYFGRDDWAAHAPGLKSIDDATALRRKILLALERAETEADPARRRALLTFVVIGGGPTGIEMAGAIAELAHRSVSRDFRSITPHCSRVILVDAGACLLPAFPPALSAAAQRALETLGVEVRLGALVSDVTARHVRVGDDIVPTHTVVWAAGVRASAAGHWLGARCDSAGRVFVDAFLRVPDRRDIFVIGDTAHVQTGHAQSLPGIAPVAKQQGEHVARIIRAINASRPPRPFRYRHYASLATIGRRRAVIDLGRVHVTGLAAWLLWSCAHVYFLVGFRNRLSVGLALLWNYVTFARHARLITGDSPFPAPERLQPAE